MEPSRVEGSFTAMVLSVNDRRGNVWDQCHRDKPSELLGYEANCHGGAAGSDLFLSKRVVTRTTRSSMASSWMTSNPFFAWPISS